jgi:hypothetical protein
MGIANTAGYGGLGVLQWALKSRAENISSILSAHPAIKKADTLTRQHLDFFEKNFSFFSYLFVYYFLKIHSRHRKFFLLFIFLLFTF